MKFAYTYLLASTSSTFSTSCSISARIDGKPGEGDRPDFPVWGGGIQVLIPFTRKWILDNTAASLNGSFGPALNPNYMAFGEASSLSDDGMNAVPNSYREAGTMISLFITAPCPFPFGCFDEAVNYNDNFFVSLFLSCSLNFPMFV